MACFLLAVVPGYHQELAGRSIPSPIIHSATVSSVSNEPDKTAALAKRTHYGLWAFGGVLMMTAMEFLLRGSPGIASPQLMASKVADCAACLNSSFKHAGKQETVPECL